MEYPEYYIDMSKVVLVSEMSGDDDEDTTLLKGMLSEAQVYIQEQEWCETLLECYFGFGIGGIFAVFLFYILPSHDDVDEYVWVVYGDITPLFITTLDVYNPALALEGYIREMRKWVKAVFNKEPLDDIAPVNAPPTKKNAESLKWRLDFIEKEFLSMYEEDIV